MQRLSGKNISGQSELEAIFEAGEKIMGFVPNDGLIMAHQPAILKSFLSLVQSVLTQGEVQGGLKRLMGLLVSRASGCEYCQAHASNGAVHQNESEAKIKAVWEYRTHPLFSEAERAALEVAYKSSMTPNATTDKDFKTLQYYFSESQIVEIVATISMYAFLNRWNSTFKTKIENSPKNLFDRLRIKG